ncbi:MAG TPA: GTPase ObgE [Rectinemataceae bacterium]|nr:GTPase ObgE [Rectinemataceae bacterium]
MIKFADEATIIVSSGNGGDGCIAFRREKYVPMGGPAGGDGGRGGDVVFEVRRNLRTLVHLRFQQTFKAQNGMAGMGKNRYGRDGEDFVIAVPPGTVIRDFDSGEVIKDFGVERGIAGAGRIGGAKKAARDGDSLTRWTFLSGGKGGKGNSHYATSVNQAPRISQPGKPGKTAKLRIELQLIGDIGFVGFPNAGKSSLLDSFTNARPKIAPYPFTTKIPNLGMLHIHDRDIVLADIPGIIEGAHEGAGLGIRFLKHISRTAALAFLIDLSDDNWKEAFPVLVEELSSFSPTLAEKRRVIIGTKLDLPEAEGRLSELSSVLPGEKIVGISVFSGAGLDELKELFHSMVVEAERLEAESRDEEDLFGLADPSTDIGGDIEFAEDSDADS